MPLDKAKKYGRKAVDAKVSAGRKIGGVISDTAGRARGIMGRAISKPFRKEAEFRRQGIKEWKKEHGLEGHEPGTPID